MLHATPAVEYSLEENGFVAAPALNVRQNYEDDRFGNLQAPNSEDSVLTNIWPVGWTQDCPQRQKCLHMVAKSMKASGSKNSKCSDRLIKDGRKWLIFFLCLMLLMTFPCVHWIPWNFVMHNIYGLLPYGANRRLALFAHQMKCVVKSLTTSNECDLKANNGYEHTEPEVKRRKVLNSGQLKSLQATGNNGNGYKEVGNPGRELEVKITEKTPGVKETKDSSRAPLKGFQYTKNDGGNSAKVRKRLNCIADAELQANSGIEKTEPGLKDIGGSYSAAVKFLQCSDDDGSTRNKIGSLENSTADARESLAVLPGDSGTAGNDKTTGDSKITGDNEASNVKTGAGETGDGDAGDGVANSKYGNEKGVTTDDGAASLRTLLKILVNDLDKLDGFITPAAYQRLRVYVLYRVLTEASRLFLNASNRFAQMLALYFQQNVLSLYGLELNRVASFSALLWENKPSVLTMSSAGFFSTRRNDEVMCFSCGLTLSQWAPGMHPLSLHRQLSADACTFVRNPANSGNIAMGTLSSPKAHLRDSTVVSQAAAASGFRTATSDSASIPYTDSARGVGSGESCATCSSGKSPTSCNHWQSLLPEGVSVVLPESIRSAGVTRESLSSPDHARRNEDLLKREAFRLSTFENNWNYSHIVSAAHLARNGFSYTGVGDRVQCAFCQGVLRNWEKGDNVAQQHAQHFTYCRFVQGHDVGNLPIPFLAPLFGTADAVNDAADDGASLGIIRSAPKHPDLAVEARRMSTFATWPAGAIIQPEALVKAGFFYTGRHDEVRCFYCDGTNRDWEQQTDAWAVHARCRPSCQYVIQVKGSDFVTRHNVNQAGTKIDAEKTRSTVDPREIRARVDTPKVQILLQMNYPLDLVKEVIQKRLETASSDHETSEDLLADIFAVHDEKQASALRNSALPLSSDVQLQPVVIRGPSDAGSTITQPVRVGQHHDVDHSLPTAEAGAQAAAAAAPLVLPTAVPVPSGITVSPRDENQQLKTQLTCKICMDALVGIVFVPCNHFIACAECAPALTKCPICRVEIRGTVRTIL